MFWMQATRSLSRNVSVLRNQKLGSWDRQYGILGLGVLALSSLIIGAFAFDQLVWILKIDGWLWRNMCFGAEQLDGERRP